MTTLEAGIATLYLTGAMTGADAAGDATAWSSAAPMGATTAHIAGSLLAADSTTANSTGPAIPPGTGVAAAVATIGSAAVFGAEIGSTTVAEAGMAATLAATGLVTAVECSASAILATGGPAAVPFQLCCALTIIRAGGPDPVPFACGAVASSPVGDFVDQEDPGAAARVGDPVR
ncbi:MAG TPA: hypothetical protein VGQ26_06040 [Streptosporangiaceae bacterium]|nr:hypothetical protein [Streptosporangiaceae bacterium]